MYGPGVYDMKAGLVQTLFALEAVSEAAHDCDRFINLGDRFLQTTTTNI
jgi:acetylornithine deacetylase/succinyl-diaminopimelate desuccinylase-like protein